ncbi:ribonuclease P protein subunit p25-like protein [Harpegnathos saltator]|uniref:Alba-like protein C9orf23-like protein n=1 Tax=Harpegnathos saltator TaxID=610380 RepID=E2BHY2_HARSA|nr:ribonuclease P protein subunit p25-like protein [Harpegnathos saltator]XP_011139146.1 ribonuclease P protein subunit p25-like protein [Harpegnathos saltator]XP_025157377.1 ribonuclease P protein subunit p25-like protein [Harpegnathos saltator]XP_025157378.1 ribonuclease P protein subunit p25-like protein [Harpegnathos saltator]XP_025157379.1 ribonuclease P protein subunit p25-like protein [Harpegnathos saltator]EFN84698.1 Alba-like protein C9orf23-like protein [Harpegnathos saltator]
MGRSRLKKKLKLEESREESTDTKSTTIPIKNLPEKFICMHVKSGTKIRNVLGYALKEFPNYDSVVWTGVGQAIGKTISCAELFKRRHEDLHQVTKLRYTKRSKGSKGDATDEIHQIPEIHILLTKNVKDTTELGYQAPGDCGEFLEKEDAANSKTNTKAGNANHMARIDTEQFSAMGLRIGQKRPRDTQADSFLRKNKKSRS